ncbi:MAG TPA: LytTR family transcriptional regulator DNA-binding domain-containing protein [Bacteroidales bacterium]|nr:LytTR family transcriptional regulator DNA-binding domain-containing protein [Bacteroidales bacterium]
MMTAIIIEDEQPARELVKSYLKAYPAIELLGEFSDGFSGIKAINDLRPDLVFLDIQMPKLTGFEMLEILDHMPNIIFTTAYDQFAIKAFEMNAIDYLLKPFSKERFSQAIEKALDRFSKKQSSHENITGLKKHVQSLVDKLERVVVKTGSKIKVIPVEDIVWLESQDDYVMIYTASGKYLKQETMKNFEEHLDPGQFIRVHRSYIVRLDSIVQLELYEKGSYLAVLNTGAKVKVSDSGYKNLKSKMNF